MKKILITVLFLAGFSFKTFSNEYLINQKSYHSVKETINRFIDFANQKGLTIFARIDHQANAEQAKLKMRPEEVVFFGSAKIGTPLMIENPLMGIELPLKMVAYQDNQGQVWLSYISPRYFKEVYNIKNDKILKKMGVVLKVLSNSARGK